MPGEERPVVAISHISPSPGAAQSWFCLNTCPLRLSCSNAAILPSIMYQRMGLQAPTPLACYIIRRKRSIKGLSLRIRRTRGLHLGAPYVDEGALLANSLNDIFTGACANTAHRQLYRCGYQPLSQGYSWVSVWLPQRLNRSNRRTPARLLHARRNSYFEMLDSSALRSYSSHRWHACPRHGLCR